MTGLMTWILLLAFLGSVGVHVYSRRGWVKAATYLRGQLDDVSRQLKQAETSENLITALREGLIGIDDLREAGFREVRQEATPVAALPPAIVPSLPRPEIALHAIPRWGYYMDFRKSPSRRLRRVSQIDAGHETWVSVEALAWYPNTRTLFIARSASCGVPSADRTVRVRKNSSGNLEVGLDPAQGDENIPQLLRWSDDHLAATRVVTLRKQDRVIE